MTRELFIEIVSSLEEQNKHDIEVSELLGKVFPNAFAANLLPDNCLLSDALIKILKTSMNDCDDWIEYFCFELDYGRKFEMGMVTYKERNYDLSDSGKLWDYLNVY